MSEFSFQCTDDQGQRWKYDLQRHRASEGQAIVRKIGALVVEPVASALGPAGVAMFLAKGKEGLLDDPEILKSVDMAALGAGARSAIEALDDALIFSVLRYTNRDGKPLIGDTGRPTALYDTVYAGNYGELVTAVWEVCRVNRFFPALDSIESVAKAGRAALAAQASRPSAGPASTST